MFRTLCGLGLILVLSGGLDAQVPAKRAPGEQGALDLQKEASRKYRELKASMRRLTGLFADSEESKARRLKAGLRLLKERGVDREVQEIEKLLAEEAWTEAIDSMGRVQRSLTALLALLMERDEELRKILEKIEQLEGFKAEVEKLIKEERAEKEASAEAEALAEHLKDLEKARARVADLIRKQEGLASRTESLGMKKKASPGLSEEQGRLMDEASDLEKRLETLEEENQALNGDASEGSLGASGAMGSAKGAMGKAEGKLGAGNAEGALDDQEKALDHLREAEEALKELEEEARRKLQEIPFEPLAREQLRTMKSTDDLARKMEEAEEGEAGEGEGDPVPGRRNVEQAVPKQKNAAGSLKKLKPGKAKQDQQDAEDELEEAKRKLEDALNQLRQELQEEVLRALEERFAEMLARQKELTSRTSLTQARRAKLQELMKPGETPPAIRRACERLSRGEYDLENEAKSALELLIEEGTSAVFPEIVKELAEELGTVGEDLLNLETGEGTRTRQKYIEKILAALLEALEQEIQTNEGDEGEP